MEAALRRRAYLAAMAAIVAAGLAVRLWIAHHWYGTFDVGSWVRALDHWRQGLPLYDGDHRYSYGPAWFWTLAAVSRFQGLGWPAYFVVKLPLILADLALVFLVVRLAAASGAGQAQKLAAAALFFLNPVSFLNTAYHGQFDNLSYVFVLAACLSEVSPGRRWGRTLLLFSAAVAVKQSTALLTPVFAFRQEGAGRKALFFLLTPALLALTLLPYLFRDPGVVFSNVVADSFNLRLDPMVTGWTLTLRYALYMLTRYDLTENRPVFEAMAHAGPVLFAAVAVLAYRLRRLELVEALVVHVLLVYVSATLMAPQYTLWIVPLAAVRRDRMLVVYSALVTHALLLFYVWHESLRLGLVGRDLGIQDVGPEIVAWLGVFAWTYLKLKEHLSSPRPGGAS